MNVELIFFFLQLSKDIFFIVLRKKFFFSIFEKENRMKMYQNFKNLNIAKFLIGAIFFFFDLPCIVVKKKKRNINNDTLRLLCQ